MTPEEQPSAAFSQNIKRACAPMRDMMQIEVRHADERVADERWTLLHPAVQEAVLCLCECDKDIQQDPGDPQLSTWVIHTEGNGKSWYMLVTDPAVLRQLNQLADDQARRGPSVE